MKVEVRLIEDLKEPYVVVYASHIDEEVQKTVNLFQESSAKDVIIAIENERNIILHAEEIYMIRIENEKPYIYCQKEKYVSKKRLVEVEVMLNQRFMRISKTTIINLDYIKGVEAGFGGMMLLIMKNGCKDYVSRKYLPNLKKYLGL